MRNPGEMRPQQEVQPARWWTSRAGRERHSFRLAPLKALVAGDVPRQVQAVVQALPAAGYEAARARTMLEVVERATSRNPRPERHPIDLFVLVLSREAWTYVEMLEVLVHELGAVPIVVFTESAARFVPRLEALGVVVVERLPFASSTAGGQLTPPKRSASAAGALDEALAATPPAAAPSKGEP